MRKKLKDKTTNEIKINNKNSNIYCSNQDLALSNKLHVTTHLFIYIYTHTHTHTHTQIYMVSLFFFSAHMYTNRIN